MIYIYLVNFISQYIKKFDLRYGEVSKMNYTGRGFVRTYPVSILNIYLGYSPRANVHFSSYLRLSSICITINSLRHRTFIFPRISFAISTCTCSRAIYGFLSFSFSLSSIIGCLSEHYHLHRKLNIKQSEVGLSHILNVRTRSFVSPYTLHHHKQKDTEHLYSLFLQLFDCHSQLYYRYNIKLYLNLDIQ